MIFIIRLNKGVVGELVGITGVQKILKSAEHYLLVLEQVDYLERGTGGVVIEELRCAPGGCEPFINALERRWDIEHIHSDVVEGRPIEIGRASCRERGEI